MDLDKLIAKRVIVIEDPTDAHWSNVQEVSFQYCLATRKTVGVLPSVRLCHFVLDDCVEDNGLLGVLHKSRTAGNVVVAHILSNEGLVFELGFKAFKSAHAKVTDLLHFLQPPECHPADKVESALLWVVLLDIIDCLSQHADVLGSNHPGIRL